MSVSVAKQATEDLFCIRLRQYARLSASLFTCHFHTYKHPLCIVSSNSLVPLTALTSISLRPA